MGEPLTMSARAKTIGNPKLLIMNPIVMNMDRSTYDGPNNALCIDRLMISVGITENMYNNNTKLGHHKLEIQSKKEIN